MARSGPCGSDTLGTSSTSSGSAPVLVAMQYQSQNEVKSPCKLARRLLREWVRHNNGQFAAALLAARAGMALAGVQALRERPYGESDTDHQQQELFVMVAARLAADQVFRAGVRRNHHRDRKSTRLNSSHTV